MKWHPIVLAVSLFFGVRPTTESAEFHVEQSETVSLETLETLANAAISNRFEIQSLDSRISASALNEQSISVWRDPEVGVGPVFYDSDRIAPSQFGDIGYTLRQTLPKRNEKPLLVAEAKLAETRWRFERALSITKLRRDIYVGLIRNAELVETMAILHRDLEWIQTLISRKENRFKVQQAGHNELMALQNERGLQELRLEIATNDLETVRFRIHRLIARPLTEPLPVFRLPIPVNTVDFSTNLLSVINRLNPELQILHNSLDQASNAKDQAQLALKPRWSVQGDASQYSGDGGFRELALRIGFTIPWANGPSKRATIAARSEETKAAAAALSEASAELAERMYSLTQRMKSIDQSIRIHRDEIQLRRQEMAASAQSAWEVNRGSLDDLLKQRRALITEQLTIVQLTAQIHTVMADILQLAGVRNPTELQTELSH